MTTDVETVETETTTPKKRGKKSKKAAKKNAENGTAVRGASYAPSAKGEKVDTKELGAQESVLFAAFQKKSPVTVAELADLVDGKIETRQDIKRVCAFYMTQWVKNGLVKKV